jgi:Domain of unknown function (DUF4307)
VSTPLDRRLDERYGRRAGGRFGARTGPVVVAVALLVVALGFIAWVTIDQRPDLAWDDIGYHVVSDGEIEVTFDVSFHGGGDRAAAVCTVQALNALRTEVGRRDVRVGADRAGPHGRVRATATLRTSERATTGLVDACVPAARS